MDEFVHMLLNDDSVCGTILPRIAKRDDLEEQGKILEYKSEIEAELALELEQ